MELSRLEAFLEIARLGSLRSAANSLHLGQPAISARIALLEQELGARVFERSRKGMVLTPAGQALLPHARRAIEAARLGREAVKHVEQGDEGELVIAAAAAINASLVPELVARFRRFHPGVHLYVRTGATDVIADLVAGGEARIGLLRETHARRLRCTPLYAEELLLVAHAEHPFVSAGRIDIGRLADATLILHDRSSDDFELARALLRDAGVSPYGAIEVDSVDTARRLVARGLGVSLLPSTVVGADIDSGELARVRLARVPTTRRRIVALERDAGTGWAPVETLRRLLSDAPTYLRGALPLG